MPRYIDHIMGMPIVLDIISPNFKAADACFDIFKQTDQRFSPFKKQSELNKYKSGMLTSTNISSQMKQIERLCEYYYDISDGYFSANYLNTFDPTGLVKGWAIQKASQKLISLGISTFMINAGGDVLVASTTNKIWTIGLTHPSSSQSIFGTLQAKNLAVATSGTYQKGTHIINPKTSLPNKKIISVTVTGPNIVDADVFATAVQAMGKSKGLKFIESQPNYEVIIVNSNLEIFASSGFGITSKQTVQQ